VSTLASPYQADRPETSRVEVAVVVASAIVIPPVRGRR
jgi:hypothetical protein